MDFLSASSAQEMNVINSGLIRNYITLFSTRIINKTCSCCQNTTAPGISPLLPSTKKLSTRTGAA